MEQSAARFVGLCTHAEIERSATFQRDRHLEQRGAFPCALHANIRRMLLRELIEEIGSEIGCMPGAREVRGAIERVELLGMRPQVALPRDANALIVHPRKLVAQRAL